MPRFYFDTEVAIGTTIDQDGIELADEDPDIREARNALADLARDILPELASDAFIITRVRDEAGKTVQQLVLFYSTHHPSSRPR